MPDSLAQAAIQPPAAPSQRSSGRIVLSMKRRAEATVLDRLHQSGPLRLRLIRPEPHAAPTAILLNTAGGIAGGDRHTIEITSQPATSVTITTQGADRIYRAAPDDPPAQVTTRLTIADHADLEFLPQETILYDRAALHRTLRIDLTETSRYLGLESLIFGRTAMGETIQRLDLTDTIALHRDGILIFRDSLKPPAAFKSVLQSRTMFDGATGLATILLASPNATALLDPVRAALADTQSGASAWNGLLLVRILAQTGFVLRTIVLRVLAVLREGRPMPRVWGC